jgi:predicted Zn-dependent peptidase
VGRGVVAEERQPVAQGKLAIGYRTRGTAFSPEAYALRAMTGVLGAFSHSKLFRNVRERASLAYYVYARLDGLKGAVYVHAGIDPQNYARARAIVEAQVADLAAGEISDEEWQSTLLMLESQLRALTDHPRRMVDRHLERSLAGGYVPVADERERLLSLSRHEVAEAAAGLSPDVVFFLHG